MRRLQFLGNAVCLSRVTGSPLGLADQLGEASLAVDQRQVGRKPVILGGMLLAAITYDPLYLWLGTVTQPGNINYPVAVFIIFILVCYVGMVYGPVGAFLAEFFPGRIRYTSVSVPYHIGNGWGGGLVPFITSAAFAATGSIGYALIYPIVVPAVCFVLAVFIMPETRRTSIWEQIEPKTAS